ncbi:10463_t:CDS:10 [Scutellospora calospora]|uniref:10463_t:CDS:1 n=1 Tax=Scutellospora calospora TaxID=85575 RepID=A0ACA9KTE4_9GLOM|nr:10463_t:CDS:10 [Scutellospora calospora]
MAQPNLASALVDWVNTFRISRPITINDLADVAVMNEALCTIDNKWFKFSNDNNREDNYLAKVKKLQQLYPRLTHYYQEVLGFPVVNLDQPNLLHIAKDGSLDETIKLWSMILTLAVRSDKNAVYIEKIQSLSPTSQQGLMVSIERVMSRLGELTVQQPVRQLPPPIPIPEPEFNKSNAEYRKIIEEKETIEKTLTTLLDDFSELRSQYDDLQGINDDLRQKLREMESGKDFHLRVEIDNLRHELSRSENQRHETELLVERSNITINDLTKKIIDLTEQADRAAQLNDQLDEHRHSTDKLKKAENVIEKYKKKFEETADIRRTLKVVEQDNQQLNERNRHLEDEYRKVSAYKTLMEGYKKQIDALQIEKAELITQNNKLEYENKHMRTKIEAHELAQSRDMEAIRLLEDRLREIEFGDGERLQLDDEKTEVVGNNDRSIEDEMKESTMAGLRLKVNELERELARVRDGKPAEGDADTARLLVLEVMLEDVNRSKAKLEKDYNKVQKEKQELESELRIQQNGSTSNGVDKSENRKSFERELMETKRKLIDAQFKLTQAGKDGDEAKSDSTLESRIKDLEAEKEELKRSNEELNSFIQSLKDMSEDDLKSQNIQLHQQIADKAKKIEASRQLIKGQHEIIEANKSREASMKAEMKAYTEEISRLKQSNEEARQYAAKEIKLITSAWFSMGRRIQGDHVFLQRQGPTSFLGQQRTVIDASLKRR